jgi:hypothetical protein
MPINRSFVESDLTILSECDSSEDFVAIAVMVDIEGIGYHSGLVICIEEIFYFFHYTGAEVLMDEINVFTNDLFIKKMDIIEPEKVEYFKGFCEILLEEVQPQYGWVFTDSFYNGDGTYYSEIGLPDITTCVGFCINVIRGSFYNNESYISIEEWDSSSFTELQQSFMNHISSQLSRIEQIDPERLNLITQNNFKRITPSELTSSAFYKDLPISKQNIDELNPTTIDVLAIKYLQ